MKYKFEKITYKVLLLVVFSVFSNAYAKAQATGPCDPLAPEPGCEDYDPDTNVPIDGGASILVAAGVAYGLKKIHDKRKQNKEEVTS